MKLGRLLYTILVTTSAAFSQDARYDAFYTNSLYSSNWSKQNSKQQFEALWYTTPSYKKEALDLILNEANQVANELKLQETFPITEKNLCAAFVGAPIIEIKGQGMGNVTTTNYAYFVGPGNKLFSVVRANHDTEVGEFVEKYRWPLSRLDTNAACKLAMRWMKDARMDVAKLNHDLQLNIEPVTVADEGDTNDFVPIYHVGWRTPALNQYKWHTVASIELFLPTKTLLDMTVEDPHYILRDSLQVTNLDYMSNLIHTLSPKN